MIGKNLIKYSLKKKIFHSNQNVEDITEVDYWKTKTFLKDFERYELDPSNFLIVPGLAWQAALIKDSKVGINGWYNYVINVRKSY